MIHLLLRTKQFVPNEFHHSFFDIDFERLYNDGFQYIITDLDNTLISYDEALPTPAIHEAFQSIQTIGFQLVLLSNNHPPRIAKFVAETDVKGFANARKPLLIGIKKAIKSMPGATKDNTVIIGDQLVTDIYGANRFGAYSILVNPLKKKTEKWYTKMNRRLERNMIRKIKKKLPQTYQALGLEGRT